MTVDDARPFADAVVYGVVPRNFDPPGFAGVTARLDDLHDLGVTVLWLAPLTRTLPGHYGYEVTDYFDVRPDYGTKEDFRDLVDAAHDRGLRVLMDFVPNHTSVAHPWFQDAESQGRASPYWDHYDRDEDGNSTHYFDWDHLPNLNYDNPDVRRFMIEAFAYWLRELDVDGFRLDAIWGIKERRPDWLGELIAELKRIKPDALLIAEASARDPFYTEQGFAAAYDWTEELGRWAWSDVFGGDAPIGAAMADVLTGGRGDDDAARVLRFLNNNDTGPRFITTHGVELYRVALAMLLTLPGLPCLFTGDEVGAAYEPYAQTGPIDWTDRFGLREETKRLIALRRQAPALRSGTWVPLPVEPAEALFAYLRSDETAQACVVVLLNFSPADLSATISLPERRSAHFGTSTWRDPWSRDEAAVRGGRLLVSIPGWSYRLLARDDARRDDRVGARLLRQTGPLKHE